MGIVSVAQLLATQRSWAQLPGPAQNNKKYTFYALLVTFDNTNVNSCFTKPLIEFTVEYRNGKRDLYFFQL